MANRRCILVNFMGIHAPRVDLQRKSLLRAGLDVVYVTTSYEGAFPTNPGLRRLDVETPFSGWLERRAHRLGLALRYVEYLARLWYLLGREVSPGDIVLLNHSFALFLVPRLTRSGVRVIYDVLELPALVQRSRGRLGRLYAWISDTLEDRYVPRLAGVSCVPSRDGWLAERLRALQPDVVELWNVPSREAAVDEALAEQIRERFRGKKLVIYSGRLHAGKGLEIFPELVRRTVARHPEAHFLIVGAVQVPGGGEAWLREAGIGEHCTLVPWVPSEALHTYLICAYVGLFLTIETGSMAHFGLGGERKPFDYMAAGLPFITPTYLPAFEFFSRNGVALQADTTDAIVVAQALLELLGRPALREEMARECLRLFRERYCWEEQEGAFLHLVTGMQELRP